MIKAITSVHFWRPTATPQLRSYHFSSRTCRHLSMTTRTSLRLPCRRRNLQEKPVPRDSASSPALHSVKDAEQKAAGSYVSFESAFSILVHTMLTIIHSTSWKKSLERRRRRRQKRCRSSRLAAQQPILAPGGDKAPPRDQERRRRHAGARGRRRGGRERGWRSAGQRPPSLPSSRYAR